ncbi:MAG: hypothetical protein F7C35_03395 [Desulfurococcales archaeon]|nr:hypothetical protein [Desulfurococcales archaeon]
MGVWPGLLGANTPVIPTFENVASLIHFLAALLFCTIGCGRRFFTYYTIYQFITTIVKTMLIPGESVQDWTWDIVGDLEEYLAGMGTALLIGISGKMSGWRHSGRICSHRGLLSLFSLLMIVWALVLLRYIGAF